jgi:tRNA-Thr(GGU) m(6)t(6)A37 methyltransferase TsaA
MDFCLKPIGIIHSCFKEKFGIPRQAGLVSEARAVLQLLPPYHQETVLNGLEEFSHIWIIFVFHASFAHKWKTTVRPPRLGGNRRIGVFATRSNFRPNALGLSCVELEQIEKSKKNLFLHLKGGDFLDQTPVLDIKPYLVYADSLPNAQCSFAQESPCSPIAVEFTRKAEAYCFKRKNQIPYLKPFIIQMLQNDPRPAYLSTAPSEKQRFANRIFDFDVKWCFEEGKIVVMEMVENNSQTVKIL